MPLFTETQLRIHECTSSYFCELFIVYSQNKATLSTVPLKRLMLLLLLRYVLLYVVRFRVYYYYYYYY
jgi:hypothetical protein